MGVGFGGSKNRKRIKQRYRERRAREHLESLSGPELAALRKELARKDKDLTIPDGIGSPSLEIWEYMKRRGKVWADRLRGK